MRDTQQDKFLDTSAAAHYLGYSNSCLEWWRTQKRGPRYFKIGGGRIRYKQSDLDAYIESGAVEPREA